jgi:predicted NBD/HSP70 family sugar kinase
VFIEDPARSITYYMKKYRVDPAVQNLVYVFIGKGVGSGVYIGGRLYRGSFGMAGEIGHIKVSENGIRCKCGNYGCLETVASTVSILKQVREGVKASVMTRIADYGEEITLEALRRAADENDKFALKILEDVGKHLGKALLIVLNAFNPQLVLLGGEGSLLGHHLLEYIRPIIKNNTFHLMNERTDVQIAEYHPHMESISVGVEAFDTLFEIDEGGSDGNIFVNSLLDGLIPRG